MQSRDIPAGRKELSKERNVRKIFIAAIASFMLATSALAADEQNAKNGNPISQLTGSVWQQSKPENKRAVLFGIDTVIAIDQAVDAKMREKAGKKKIPSALSIFEKNWMDAFKNTTREEIVAEVDKWYEANPGQMERPVMDVIWYEIIVPRTKASK